MAPPAPPALRRGARIAGWLAFAAFELAVVALASIVASIRCCASAGAVGPQSAVEWGALAMFAGTMLLLGGAVGLGVAFAIEALTRLVDRLTKRREPGP